MNWIVKIEDSKNQRINVIYKPQINSFLIKGQIKGDRYETVWVDLIQKQCSSGVTLEELVNIFEEVINEINQKLNHISEWDDIFKNKLTSIKIVEEQN
jgi:hypothetical protein